MQCWHSAHFDCFALAIRISLRRLKPLSSWVQLSDARYSRKNLGTLSCQRDAVPQVAGLEHQIRLDAELGSSGEKNGDVLNLDNAVLRVSVEFLDDARLALVG